MCNTIKGFLGLVIKIALSLVWREEQHAYLYVYCNLMRAAFELLKNGGKCIGAETAPVGAD